MKTPTLSSTNPTKHSPLRLALLLNALALPWLAPSQLAKAQCSQICDSTNVGFGVNVLVNNVGANNTAIGDGVLFLNTIGTGNTAIGYAALTDNATGSDNTATGVYALLLNTSGGENTTAGAFALYNNTTGSDNTASGVNALFSNSTGESNIAIGSNALLSNTTGSNNTALGNRTLVANTIGKNNTAVGDFSGSNLTTGSNNIHIGNKGVAGDANTIRIGKGGTQTATFIAGISGAAVPDGVGVIIGPNGKLGTLVSSASFKDHIRPMDKASEAILALKPVTFRYKRELDPDGIPQFGLVAEDVEKVNPDLVARDEQGKPYTVRYEAVNAMLLNEFLKEHKTVQELKSTVAKQEALAAQQQRQIEALSAGLQKVSAQLEVNKLGQRTVVANQ
jgi:hypothetical protein